MSSPNNLLFRPCEFRGLGAIKQFVEYLAEVLPHLVAVVDGHDALSANKTISL